MTKHDPKEVVEFGFVLKHRPFRFEYIRDIVPIEPTHEVKGFKTLKLFKSWFKLAMNRNHPLYGFVRFKDGETWIWQRPEYVEKVRRRVGGWQLARKSNAERERERKQRQHEREQHQHQQTALWEDFILKTAGLTC